MVVIYQMTYSNFQQILDGLEVGMSPDHRARVNNLDWGTIDVVRWNHPFDSTIVYFPVEEEDSD